MRVVDKLIEQHSMGSNCGTNACKCVFQYYGYDFTESMIFGLGSGLGFIYQYYSNDNSYFLSGKNESLELNLSMLFGGTMLSGSFDKDELAWERVKEFIDHDMPVILDLSIRYLPYFEPYLESVGNIGFGLHNAVLAGYDEKERTVTLLDHRWQEPLKISMDALNKSRGARDSSMNPRNAYKVILPPVAYKKRYDDDIAQAIALNINRMRYPFAFKMGLDGIKMFKREIKSIFSRDDWQDKVDAVNTFGILMEKLGTGGGNFRRIYGRFLREAAGITMRKELGNIGNQYMSLANEWKRLSQRLMQCKRESKSIEMYDLEMNFDSIIEGEYLCIDALENALRR